MVNQKLRMNSLQQSVEIDEEIKKLLFKGVRKAGSQGKLAQILGYSYPTNIVWQFLKAPKYRKFIPKRRFEELKTFLRE